MRFSKQVGKDRVTIANSLRLLRLPQNVIEDLKNEILSRGHGKVLLSLEDFHEQRMELYKEIKSKGLSVRMAEARANELKTNAVKKNPVVVAKKPKSKLAERMANLSLELTRNMTTRVEVKGSERRGKIVVHYSTRQDLDRILTGMQNQEVWHRPQT